MTTRLATKLVVFLSEDDRYGHQGLAEVVLDRARAEGIAGATIWRGIEGFGRSGQVRTTRFPDLAAGLPLAVELIDSPERIEAFLDVLAPLVPGALVTREEVELRRAGGTEVSPDRASNDLPADGLPADG